MDTFKKETGVIVGTGPSLSQNQIDLINKSNALIVAVNLTYEIVNWDVLVATNKNFWDFYHDKINLNKHCWCPHKKTADKYGISYIEERNAPGLSRDKSYIHHHHGSGPIAVNIAYHYGCKRILLVGWDMKHQPNNKRHYFGEYPEPLRHFTRNLGPDGELVGLIREMSTIKPEEYGIEIINCTPGSALRCFPFGELEDYL